MPAGVVIAGGGQGGYQTAASLRTEGYAGPITLISDEPGIPYQRPPLSKAFLLGKQTAEKVALRPESFYSQHRIRLLAEERVVSIDRAGRAVKLASGGDLPYETLVLATGARNRELPVVGAGIDGVCYLRTLGESVEIKQRLENAGSVVVVGGGFIGLEIAASARTLGKSVTVIEAQSRLMFRAVAPVLSEYYLELHRSHQVEVILEKVVSEIRGDRGKVSEVVLLDGSRRAADLVVVGIGVVPNLELARDAGLAVANGVSVDEYLCTSDPRIYAIGDCAEHPSAFAGGRVRLESVQNAVDQALSVARAITGKRAPYTAVPWFWSDQFDARLQMAGLPHGTDQSVTRGDVEGGKFSVYHYRAGQLRAVDSINRPGDHIAARKLLAS
jgi:3-phenylpropionate/trans-cinnamate dioxygenase ferredoxin reductase subunit